MRVSHFLSAAVCAGALIFAGIAWSEEPPAEPAEPAASVENGQALFTERCAVCHGTVSPAPSVLGKLDAAAFDKKVQEHAPVAAFDGLTADDLRDIHAWLQTQAGE